MECDDRKCAKHGGVKVRGNIFTGRVISGRMERTVTIEREITHYVRKYERYQKVRSRIKAHNPPCVNAKEGDIARVGETRKLSKTKSFVVLNVLGRKGEGK